jgi:hypothetical protein
VSRQNGIGRADTTRHGQAGQVDVVSQMHRVTVGGANGLGGKQRLVMEIGMEGCNPSRNLRKTITRFAKKPCFCVVFFVVFRVWPSPLIRHTQRFNALGTLQA